MKTYRFINDKARIINNGSDKWWVRITPITNPGFMMRLGNYKVVWNKAHGWRIEKDGAIR